MTDTPSEIIAELRELMGRATKGPWQVTHCDGTITAYANDNCWSADVYDPDDRPLRLADAALIVATHNALPTLLALLDEAVGALEDVVNPLDHARRLAEAGGCRLSGEAYQVCNSLNYVQQIARAVLAKIKETQ